MATKLQTRKTEAQATNREKMMEMFQNSPIPADELMVNLQLYTRSSVLAKMMYIKELYELILETPGVIMEFGTWWGSNLALFENFRAIHEPYNYSRRIYGFDTFEGYANLSDKDGTDALAFEGNYATASGYKAYLEQMLDLHENENVMGNMKKTFLIEGDVTKTSKQFFKDNPETIVSLAYFDMQVYAPTKAALEAIKPHLTKGSVIAMDEINCPEFPGETQAFQEVFGTANVRLKRSKYLPDRAYFIVE
tara:strand:+ start:44923 stop:45672 length:750 start_codon:yes stop_codon:yes gene_type:complete